MSNTVQETAQLRCTEPHTLCAELHTTQAEITINRTTSLYRNQFSIAKQSSAETTLDCEVIKLHNFVVQSHNELLILDCEAIEILNNCIYAYLR